ncbi:MAG: hypothetical protein DRJ28_03945 [Actinobacteria bacterium]|nr:MAG: hypothetical protein DRJ28_03945 [Actinomycetota bacterium]
MSRRSASVSAAALLLVLSMFALQACSSSNGNSDAADEQAIEQTASTSDSSAHDETDHDHGEQPETNNDDEALLVVTGTVIDVKGDLTAITLITLLTEDGEKVDFVPADGVLFDGGPISHVRDHLISGTPVKFEYRELDDGSLEALTLGDAHE